jgi:hypothetical protein
VGLWTTPLLQSLEGIKKTSQFFNYYIGKFAQHQIGSIGHKKGSRRRFKQPPLPFPCLMSMAQTVWCH